MPKLTNHQWNIQRANVIALNLGIPLIEGDSNKYTPHSSKREIERRKKQLERARAKEEKAP